MLFGFTKGHILFCFGKLGTLRNPITFALKIKI